MLPTKLSETLCEHGWLLLLRASVKHGQADLAFGKDRLAIFERALWTFPGLIDAPTGMDPTAINSDHYRLGGFPIAADAVSRFRTLT